MGAAGTQSGDHMCWRDDDQGICGAEELMRTFMLLQGEPCYKVQQLHVATHEQSEQHACAQGRRGYAVECAYLAGTG